MVKCESRLSGNALAGAGSAGVGAARTGTAGVLGKGGPLQRLHWLISSGPGGIVHIEAETLTRDPYYRHPCQDAPLEQDQQGRNRVAVDQQLPPSPKRSDYWGRP